MQDKIGREGERMKPKHYSEHVMAVMDSLSSALRQYLRRNDTLTVQLTIHPVTGRDVLLVHSCGEVFGWIDRDGSCIFDFQSNILVHPTKLLPESGPRLGGATIRRSRPPQFRRNRRG